VLRRRTSRPAGILRGKIWSARCWSQRGGIVLSPEWTMRQVIRPRTMGAARLLSRSWVFPRTKSRLQYPSRRGHQCGLLTACPFTPYVTTECPVCDSPLNSGTRWRLHGTRGHDEDNTELGEEPLCGSSLHRHWHYSKTVVVSVDTILESFHILIREVYSNCVVTASCWDNVIKSGAIRYAFHVRFGGQYCCGSSSLVSWKVSKTNRKTFWSIHCCLSEHGNFAPHVANRGWPTSTTPEVEEDSLDVVN
jgi:hypothetical protein